VQTPFELIEILPTSKGSYQSLDEYLPHTKFSYNQVVHKTTNLSPFQIVYGFNPLTPLDLLSFLDATSLIHKRVSRVESVKNFHDKVKDQIGKQT